MAAFIATLDPAVLDTVAFRPEAPTVATALTSIFFHANLLHLLGNMVFLAAVGVAVELATGSARFVAVYFLGGLLGVFAHWVVFRATPDAPYLVGASGSIAACVGYYALRYLGMKVPLAPKVGAPVAVVIGIWVLLQVLGAVVRIGDQDLAVSFWAHLGGLAAGIVLSLLFRAPDLAQIEFSHEALRRMNDRGPAASATAARAILAERPQDLAALRSLAAALEKLGEAKEEGSVRRQLLSVEDDAGIAQSVERLGEMGQLSQLAPMERMKVAGRIAETQTQAARLLLRSVAEERGSERPDALLTLGGLDRDGSPELCEAALKELVDETPLHPAVDVARQRGWIR